VIKDALVAGVHGESSNKMGIGVNGQSDVFCGVRGLAGRTPFNRAVGVFGIGQLGAHGVIGMATGGTAAGPGPTPVSVPAGFAGAFFGNLSVDGDFVVTGRKSAASRFPDGSRRLLYAVESPESWFEDFGMARLVRGRATIKVDRSFRAIVRGPYHVFLSPEGDCRGLYVRRKSATTIEVGERLSGTSRIRFSYRIVARRKDVVAPRFARFTLPKMPTNVDSTIDMPEPPQVPTMKKARTRRDASRRSRRQQRRR
jgi:hypothetical protein